MAAVSDRDRHEAIRDIRDRNRDRERHPEFFGCSYGGSHAPRPPPEPCHYKPLYGDDYTPPPRCHDSDDRCGALRVGSLDDWSKVSLSDDRRPSFDECSPPPPPAAADDHHLPLDDRPMRRLPASDTRVLPKDHTRPVADTIPLARATAGDDRGPRPTELAADDRPRGIVPLEERLSQPGPTPSLQDRLSQPAVPARMDIGSAPSLEERLSSGSSCLYTATLYFCRTG